MKNILPTWYWTFLMLPLTVYVAYRAAVLSLTHDEGLSYYIVCGDGVWKNTANHHLLNTSLMRISASLFGHSEFSLRLPNVLSFLIYGLGCFLLLKPIRRNSIRFLGLGLLLFNPFLLDFFSIARGYGISLGMLSLGLFAFFNAISRKTCKEFLLPFSAAVLFTTLAVSANLSAINFSIAALGLLALRYVQLTLNGPFSAKEFFSFLLLFALASIPIKNSVDRLLFLRDRKELYFGEERLFDAVRSLMDKSLYANPPWQGADHAIAYMAVGVFLAVLAFLLFNWKNSGILFPATALLLAMFLGLLIEHAFFDAKFPSGRSFLVYLPVYGMVVVLFMDQLDLKLAAPWSNKLLRPISALLGGLLFVHGVHAANLEYTNTWRYDAKTKEAMKLVRLQIQNTDSLWTISSHGLYEPAINYYIVSRKINLPLVDRNGINPLSTFIYDQQGSGRYSTHDVLARFDDVGSVLLIASPVRD